MSPEEKRELLRRLLTKHDVGNPGDYPLAHAQRGLWFLQRLLPDTYAYNVAFAARAAPSLDVVALRHALDRLVARHATLRTVFPEKGGQPVQRVLPATDGPLRIVDAAELSDAELFVMICKDYEIPFHLDKSAVAVTLYRRTNEDVILINVHHIVFDGRSLQVLFADLRTLYEADLGDGTVQLAPQVAQYEDFVAWEGGVLNGARGRELIGYWESVLAGDIPPLQIRSAQNCPPSFSLRGAHTPFSLGADLSCSLLEFARMHNTTLYSVCLAAMQVMLHQFSGQKDITVGTPVSLRNRREWENVIGYFINMLPMRATIDVTEPFSTHLARTRGQVLGALSHQEFPFSMMVDHLRIRRDPNRSPIFQAMLNVNVSPRSSALWRMFVSEHQESVSFGRSRLASYLIPQQDGQFELALEIIDSDGVLRGSLKYQTERYSAATAERMVVAFRSILETIVVAPDRRIEELIGHDRDTFEV